jgi:Zn-dependent protease
VDLLLGRVLVVVPLWLSLAVHEWAHAWAADQLGDDTARQLGRMTIDPTRHLDPVGTVLLPLFGVPFGWAVPVPINPLRFRGVSLATGVLLTAAAGPAANVALALGIAALHRALEAAGALSAPLEWLLGTLVPMNLALAVFNLLPVPPLDGSRIADAFVPYEHRESWAALSRISPLAVVVLVVVLESLGIGPLRAVSGVSALLLGG